MVTVSVSLDGRRLTSYETLGVSREHLPPGPRVKRRPGRNDPEVDAGKGARQVWMLRRLAKETVEGAWLGGDPFDDVDCAKKPSIGCCKSAAVAGRALFPRVPAA